MLSLYQKYRPAKFSEVVGQKHVVDTLRNSIEHQRIAHAYIFTGPRGVGKTTIARIFAKALNCLNPKNGDACEQCAVCLQLDANKLMNLIEINAADARGIDGVREINETVKFVPSIGKYKVYLIDEVHMFTGEASNALLKTLEEPPKHAVFILATTDAHKLLPTIVSRSLRFDFTTFSNEEIRTEIDIVLKGEKIKLDDEIISLVIKSAGGSMRDALSNLQKVAFVKGLSIQDAALVLGMSPTQLIERLNSLIFTGDVVGLTPFFREFFSLPINFRAFLEDELNTLRDMLLSGSGSTNDVIFVSRLMLRASKELYESHDELTPIVLASYESAMRFSKTDPAATVVSTSQPVKKQVKLQAPKIEDAEIDITPNTSELSLSDIQSKWIEFCDKLKDKNAPLAMQIKSRSPLRISGYIIVVPVKYFFHKETVESKKNAEMIQSTLVETYGLPLSIRAEVIKEDAGTGGVDAALKIFGGEVIA